MAGTAFVAMGGDITQAAATLQAISLVLLILSLDLLPQISSIKWAQHGSKSLQDYSEAVGAVATICTFRSFCAFLMAGVQCKRSPFILQEFTEVAGQLAEAAPQTLQGLVDGFVANAPALFEAAQGLFHGVVDALWQLF